ncbi:MAG: CinA family protein, partial [Candidatus Ornithomonoglobus sp.]
GLFSALITDVSGASGVFKETIVTYSNEAKMRELGVRGETLKRYGAVSHDVAYQMAEGICAHTGADIGVGITGLAGPTGGTTKKPVGTVFVGLNILGDIHVYHLLINGKRDQIREETCRFIFERLLELIP